jgi:hypothetical protein
MVLAFEPGTWKVSWSCRVHAGDMPVTPADSLRSRVPARTQ